jgi:GNAT superfamily N-acetyltransferase
MPDIVQARSPQHTVDAQLLFRDYETWFGISLCFQNFDDEVANLPGKYAPPEGRLYLAYEGDEPIGCIALRKLEDGICEMKRLFVRDVGRGKGIGKMLIDKIIGEAVTIGYQRMRLDTYPPKMGKAVSLYEAYGFYEIPAYYDNPHDGVLYIEKRL